MNSPRNYARTLGKLPKGVVIKEQLGKGKHAFVHLFVKDKASLERDIRSAADALVPEGLLCISYPNGAKTDLTRDKGWECLNMLTMQCMALISFDADWSAFLLKNTPTKASADDHSNANAWADPKIKTVKLPDDLAALLKANSEATRAFDALAYTNQKEYVLRIVGAKRDETCTECLKTISKLIAGKKNPVET